MATLSQVARAAGVSVTTASVVLNHGKQFDRISTECVQRVRRAADELGYVPNYQARSVRTGRADVIGMVLEFGDEGERSGRANRRATQYADGVLGGLEAAALEQEFMVLRIRRGRERTAVERGLRSILGKRVDGLVIPGVYRGVGMTNVLQDPPDLPLVIVEPRSETNLPSVRFDDAAGMRLLGEHLLELGHRRILFLGPTFQRRHDMPDREAFFRASVAGSASITRCPMPEPETPDDYLPESQMRAAEDALMQYLADHPAEMTAVAAYNDTVAVGALRALRRRGIRVPHDVSVTGFDDSIGMYAEPALTSVDHRLFDLGYHAGQMVLAMVKGGDATREEHRGRVINVEPRLVVRESTARVG